MVKKELIERTLDALRLSRRYLGYGLAVDAVALLLAGEEAFHSLHGSLFGRVAALHGCSRRQVERNLRTAVRHVWLMNAAGLQRMATYPLTQAPTASEFVEIVATRILLEDMPDVDPSNHGSQMSVAVACMW